MVYGFHLETTLATLAQFSVVEFLEQWINARIVRPNQLEPGKRCFKGISPISGELMIYLEHGIILYITYGIIYYRLITKD